jgi:hypothetical protein
MHNEEKKECCGGMCGGMCGKMGMMMDMPKEMKLAILEKKAKIMEIELDFVNKMMEIVKKMPEEEE